MHTLLYSAGLVRLQVGIFVVLVEGLHVLQELVGVLADEGLAVVAGDVVPLDPVQVDVVQDPHAGLGAAVDVELCVVGLGHVVALDGGLVAGRRPGLVGPARGGGVGRRHLHAGPGPEPPVDGHRLQVLAIATSEVAEAAGGPDVRQVVILHEHVNRECFLADMFAIGGKYDNPTFPIRRYKIYFQTMII